jgi:hypothetical protein
MKGLIAVSAAVAAALAIVVPGAAGVSSVSVVAPSQRVAGKTYSQWLVAYWQSLLAHGHPDIEAPTKPIGCLKQGQSGKVWFLQDAYYNDAPVTVTCTIPAGRYLFLEGPGFECSNVEPAPFFSARRLAARCAAGFKIKGVDTTVDGTPVTPSAYPVSTPVFHFVMPAKANVLKAPGHNHGWGAVRADVLMLRPLAHGQHTIVQVEHFVSGISIQTTWQLTVQ